MDFTTALSKDLRRSLMSQAEQALYQLANGDVTTLYLPRHSARMRVYEDFEHDSLQMVIIPKIKIVITNDGFMNGRIDRNSVRYFLAANDQAFPLSHVFRGSGSLCLGTIFVPELLPMNSPQLALETLFLSNDRNMDHGDPQLFVKGDDRKAIVRLLHNSDFSDESLLTEIKQAESNWCKTDLLWRITSMLLNQYEKNQAFRLADKIFDLCFSSQS